MGRLTTAGKASAIALLGASLGYNVVWVLAASPMLEQLCVAQSGAVEGDALESRERGDWNRAKSLFSYLRDYRSGGPMDCDALGLTQTDWSSPLIALALWSKYQMPAETRQQVQQVEGSQIERFYKEASARDVESSEERNSPPNS